MTDTTLHHHPTRWRDVARAQVRAVGLAMRPALAIGGALVVGTTLLMSHAVLQRGAGVDIDPELAPLAALTGLLLPIAVWKGEYDFRRSYLASMPVDRLGHVLVKIGAGWAWLMVLTAAFVLWMVALALLSGGDVGVDEMRVLARDLPAGTLPADGMALARRWTTPGWQWAVFFTGATVVYLFGSAIVLAGSRVRRWLAGIGMLILFLAILAEQRQSRWIDAWLVDGLEAAHVGRYGLANLFAAVDSYFLTNTLGEEVLVYATPSTLEQWILSTLLWLGIAMACVLAAVLAGRRT